MTGSFLSSDQGQEGLRVQLRLLVDGEPEQRFDVHGNEILQVRGHVIDSNRKHPQVVVRFSGQRRAELCRWAKPNKHLGVDGFLEVKHWLNAGTPRVALLIEALALFPLDDVDLDLSKAGIYAIRGRVGAPVIERPATKQGRVEKMRQLLDLADA